MDAPSKPGRSPRRCFICLADDTDDETPQEWVSPCPCTLEGHQACMLSWVASREGDRRPLQCPVCKAPIHVSGPWNPVAAINDQLNATLLGMAPWVLAGTTVAGVYAANFAHGIHSLATFAGHEAARSAVYMRWPASGMGDIRWSAAVTVAHLTPAMVVLRLMPGLGVNTLPSIGATAIGIYKLVHPEFRLRHWPPFPWAALFFVICMRSAYFRLWKEYGYPWERRIDRRLDNLPDEPDAPPERPAAAAARVGVRGAGILGWILERLILGLDVDVEVDEDADEARRQRQQRRQERRRQREVRALRAAVNRRARANANNAAADPDPDVQDLMNRIEALNVRMDQQFREHLRRMNRHVPPGANGQRAEEEEEEEEEEQPRAGAEADAEAEAEAIRPPNVDGDNQAAAEEVADLRIQLGDMFAAQEDDDEENEDDDAAAPQPAAPAAADDGAAPPADIEINLHVDGVDEDDNAPAPAAPAAEAAAPANRGGNLSLTVDRLIIETTVTLLFPMVCYSFGELLRLTVLPRSWTDSTVPSRGSSWWGWLSGGGQRPSPSGSGLLGKRWGRSIVGGAMFVVLRDAVRMYAKYSRLRDRSLKRVESVPRRPRD